MNDALSSQPTNHREGPVARAIEGQTIKIPSDLFLWGAGAAFLASGVLQFLGMRKVPWLRRAPVFLVARRIEMLAPMILIIGVYNKLAKVTSR
jgi:hypothetical protein